MRPVTPDRHSAVFHALCAELVPGMEPVWLDVVPVVHAVPLECFDTVRRQVEAYGGESVFGWQVWEWPGLFLEAEFHAVWRTPDGQLRDITPKPAPVAMIAFLEDPSRRFDRRRVPNLRRATTSDPRVLDFLAACDQEWAIMNRGERASQREFSLRPEEVRQLEAVVLRKHRLAIALGLEDPHRAQAPLAAGQVRLDERA
jgi:hypothetical protein